MRSIGLVRVLLDRLPVGDRLPEEIEFQHRIPSLGRGEEICLAVAYHRKAILATDDQKARQIGLQCSLDFTGTLGFLLFAIRIDDIDLTTANNLLHKLIAAGYHSPVEDQSKI